MYGICANIWGILMVNVTILTIHGSYVHHGWTIIAFRPQGLRVCGRSSWTSLCFAYSFLGSKKNGTIGEQLQWLVADLELVWFGITKRCVFVFSVSVVPSQIIPDLERNSRNSMDINSIPRLLVDYPTDRSSSGSSIAIAKCEAIWSCEAETTTFPSASSVDGEIFWGVSGDRDVSTNDQQQPGWRVSPVTSVFDIFWGAVVSFLVGGLEHEFYFPIYWE